MPTIFEKYKKTIGDQSYYPIGVIAEQHFDSSIATLPLSLKILLENAVRHGDEDSAREIIVWQKNKTSDKEIAFRPARVLLQDFTGVPAIADLAAMRGAMKNLGKDSTRINPQIPVDLVIDHSVVVNEFGSGMALPKNIAIEFQQNKERYEFLKWGQESFKNLRIVPPGLGICHQINIEYLASVIFAQGNLLYPDSLVGTDSHTTMVNGLGVFGFGVGGIEAEAAMLGQPIPMVLPEVVGFQLKGKLPAGITATDLVLTITEILRKKNVVNKFVEFYGDGLAHLSLETRATISNMAPEYGATMGLFPIDDETLRYLTITARPQSVIERVEQYSKANHLWHDETRQNPAVTDEVVLDLGQVEASLAGPKRPQDRVALHQVKAVSQSLLDKKNSEAGVDKLPNNAVVIAAITSCTNTSNPLVMLSAGLVAQKALALGLTTQPWVKTSLAPGSRVVQDYLQQAGLQESLNQLGFNIVGFGCTTCIGNSGPLKTPALEQEIKEQDLTVAAVLSGNRNFEGRIHPAVKANWLASPPLVVVYSLVGRMDIDITKDAIGKDKNGKDVFLQDIWPDNKEVQALADRVITPALYQTRYKNVFGGTQEWLDINGGKGDVFAWQAASTYIKEPPFFNNNNGMVGTDMVDGRVLAHLGDSITTDHISPAGAIKPDSPAGEYLSSHQVAVRDFNSYGSRRGNHEVMMRGTLANIRLKNLLAEKNGGFTKKQGQEMTIFSAAMDYQKEKTPLVIIAGKEYGTGSSRDWAAKGVKLLGVQAVVAVSFERIHRSNLVGMGILPLVFINQDDYDNLTLTGDEKISILGVKDMAIGKNLTMTIEGAGGKKEIPLKVRLDNDTEMTYYRRGGVLPFMLNQLAV